MSGNDVYLEDLGSTNGTTVNGQPIKKHLLQHADTVEIGKYRIRFLIDGGAEAAARRHRHLAAAWRREFYGPGPRRSRSGPPAPRLRSRLTAARWSRYCPAPMPAGSLALVKALTTIGRPATRSGDHAPPDGYFIAHVEGDAFPMVNGHNLGSAATR